MELRENQKKALTFFESREGNLLFYIATGKGKSVIALEIAKKIIDRDPSKKIVVLCPTRVIRFQLYTLFNNTYFSNRCELIQGKNTSNLNRTLVFKNIYFCCYFTFSKLLSQKDLFCMNFNVCLLDEVHKLGKENTTNFQLDLFSKNVDIRFIGFTATPGSKINERKIRSSLKVSSENILIDNELNFEISNKKIEIEVSPLRKKLCESFEVFYLLAIKKTTSDWKKYLSFNFSSLPLQRFNPYLFKLFKFRKNLHLGEISQLNEYYVDKKIRYNNNHFRVDIGKTLSITDERILSLKNEIKEKTIIFVEEIKTGKKILEYLKKETTTNLYFVSGTNRLSEKIYAELKGMDSYILISTSVSEEGLNLPLDLVINFDLPLTKIKDIQRRGRVGRYKKGMVTYLVLKNNPSEKTYSSIVTKE
jgi:ERCC4-related helicase